MSSPTCYRQKRRRPIIAKVGGISSCLALLTTTLLSAPYNTAPPILPNYNDESVIERRSNEGYSGLRNRRSLSSDSGQISNYRVSHHNNNNNRHLQIDSTCIRITTGTSSYNDGYLSVYINNGSGYTQVSSGYHSKGDTVLDTCYDGLVTVQIEGIDNNAWIGSIESSISNNEYYPMICADCAGRSDNTQNIVVDSDSGNNNYPNAAKCLNGNRCTLISDTETTDTIEESSSGNVCKDGPDHLHPGDVLLRGEFLCHGNLRFGIDFDRGQFMVGFVNGTDISSPTEFDEDIPWGGNYSSIAMPDTLAWRATPTTLFIPDDRPFSQIILKEHGNILGYDDDMVEIYDSNYDYRNRIDYKAENSFLRFSDNCKDVANIDAEEGEMCIKLVSPPTAGWPVGMTTWGVVIDPDDIVDIEHVVPTTAPVPPTSSPTITSQPSSTSRGDTSSSPTPNVPSKNSFDSTASSISESVEINYESSAIIWGTVWLDSNRNGVMDRGEQPLNNITVELFECGFYTTDTSEDSDEDEEDSRFALTDDEGAYFLQVPTGRTYRVKFHIDDDHSFSKGTDTDTNMMGSTSCETSRYVYPIQWNAGLYRIADLDVPEVGVLPANIAFFGEDDLPDSSAPTEQENASIGGHIYLDVDENGQMDNKERTAAVGGYTVRDATVAVSLTDCKTDEVIDTTTVEFPGTYSFGNLTEGFYKLGYEMEVMLRSTSTGYSGYSFIGNDSDTPTFYETPCGKLGDKEVIDSGNVGLRALRSSELDDYMIEGVISPDELDRSAIDSTTDGGNPWLIPVIVAVVITAIVVAVAAALLIKRRNKGGFPVSIGSPKSSGGGDVHSIGSNDGWDTSMISAPSADQQGIQGTPTRTHVAQMSAAEEADESESDSGLEISRPGSSSLNMISSSEGYEVYDDEDQTADYGPVVSNIIAQYHQKDQNEQQITTEQESQQSPQHQAQQESQAYLAYQYQTQAQQHGDSAVTNDYEDEASTGSSFTAESSDPPAASYRDIPSSGPSVGWDMGAHQQQQYSTTSGQYVSSDGQYYEAANYNTTNNYSDYQDPQDQHHPSDSSSSSSEDLGDSGWTSVSSSTAASSSNNQSNFNWSYGTAATTQVEGQRSSSNPRDNRQIASWRQYQSAIPENSTWEYNNNTVPSNNVVNSGFTTTQTDDCKSVLSSGSDQSADPPGASYKNVQQFPPPPRRSPTTSPNRARGYPPPPPRSYSTPRER